MSKSTNQSAATNRAIVKLFIAIALFGGIWLMLPLYMQNRMNELYKESFQVSTKIESLEVELLYQEQTINVLLSLENLQKASEGWGLELNQVPTKIYNENSSHHKGGAK